MIYASITDETGEPCATHCFTVTDTQKPAQGKGFGESVLRDLILAKRYRQEDFKTDPRLRQDLRDDDATLGAVSRTAKKSSNLIRSLNNKKTAEFIGLYFGNNAINTTELNCILPIYI